MGSLGQVRRDSKHRVLFRGESQRADGKYIFKYQINNKIHILYERHILVYTPEKKW